MLRYYPMVLLAGSVSHELLSVGLYITSLLLLLYCILPDIDECSNKLANECDINANCTNTAGSYNCQCRIGWSGKGKNCSGTIIFVAVAIVEVLHTFFE